MARSRGGRGRQGMAWWGLLFLLFATGFDSTAALAVPAYARQTGQPCSGCHIGAFGPQLTPFGRQFKLSGYTLRAGSLPEIPLSAMVVEAYTQTQKDQPAPPAKNFSVNDNTELAQASLFFAGKLTSNLGIFSQYTYSQNGGLLGWDNLDLRYADTFSAGSHNGVWGVSFNNNPTLSDVFATAPAWQFPYMGPDLAPAAPAAPILDGGLAQSVIGLSAYTQIDGAWYLEAGGYHSISASFARKVNADYPGDIPGLAPYARIARTWSVPGGDIELGGFLMSVAKGLVGTDANGNPVAVPGPTDKFRDLGVDASYQHFSGTDHIFTVNAAYFGERQRLDATYGSGGSTNLRNTLHALNINGSYWYKNTWGATVGAFTNDGSSDDLLYGGSPNTNGGIVELDWNPFGKSDSFAQPYLNMRLGLQYTFYTLFNGVGNGSQSNSGNSASANNTLFAYIWMAL